ncbi:GNAT family N-acetyltransferase [Umezawaea beigongshangensis]|uniref:GNAT family N-acetyltransferase n=1 Tax=Umezawaea beigongshangensis TaxID=2780383 RepID=UPI0018F1A107|nr:GNAT family N-acetyltransferase [Umezawaea beigongshangensis]
MMVGRGLVEAQSARFAALDPLLPACPEPPDGDVVTAAVPDGSRVAGVITHHVHRPGSVVRLWSASDVRELHPLLGGAGLVGMHTLLRAWRHRLDRVPPPGTDSAAVVTWPSRDVEATRALLDHGLVPLSTIAVRRGVPLVPERAPTLTIRRAGPADLGPVVDLALAELRYSSLVGATVLRPDAVELKRRTLGERLRANAPIWLAERDGIAVALAECAITDADPTTWAGSRLPRGRWGYLNCVSVLPGARGSGVGQQLVAHAHRELRRMGATGTYLYYNQPNPLSSVFWIRQGYRPLWTVWEVRPASALR